jgi:hypothetical protein
MAYKIQHHFTYGWDELFDEEFKTHKEAQQNLDDFLLDTKDAYELGYLSDRYLSKYFKIMEV